MSKWDKLLARICGLSRDLRFDELRKVLELGVEEILVIGHTDCGVCGMRPEVIRQHLLARGIAPEILSEIDEAGEVDLDAWFTHASGCGHPRPDHRFVHRRTAGAGAGRPENVKIPLDTGLEIWYSN